LMLLEIATPKPAAFLEKRWGPLRSRAYFITEYVQGIDACQWFNSASEDEPDTRGIVRQFAGLLCRFYEARIVHGDFKATNFILSEGRLAVTDLDAMRSYRRPTGRFRKKFKKDCRRLMKNWTDLPAIDKMFREELAKLTF
ncbi:MAG: hypothetical protein K9J85_11700, partial [Desulfobacteraceae bacterium]|nr:hypothetical protein [Desulfobacteraceae bacterium]